jgi:hypothetical protein
MSPLNVNANVGYIGHLQWWSWSPCLWRMIPFWMVDTHCIWPCLHVPRQIFGIVTNHTTNKETFKFMIAIRQHDIERVRMESDGKVGRHGGRVIARDATEHCIWTLDATLLTVLCEVLETTMRLYKWVRWFCRGGHCLSEFLAPFRNFCNVQSPISSAKLFTKHHMSAEFYTRALYFHED